MGVGVSRGNTLGAGGGRRDLVPWTVRPDGVLAGDGRGTGPTVHTPAVAVETDLGSQWDGRREGRREAPVGP